MKEKIKFILLFAALTTLHGQSVQPEMATPDEKKYIEVVIGYKKISKWYELNCSAKAVKENEELAKVNAAIATKIKSGKFTPAQVVEMNKVLDLNKKEKEINDNIIDWLIKYKAYIVALESKDRSKLLDKALKSLYDSECNYKKISGKFIPSPKPEDLKKLK